MEIPQSASVPAGAVLGAHDLYEDPYLRESGMLVTIDHSKRGRITMPGCPVRMSDSPREVRSAPLLGAHTEEVLAEWLALSKQEIQEFQEAAKLAASAADVT